MEKIKLFLDFDSTIVDSVGAYVRTYNQIFKNHPDFKMGNTNVKQYNMKDQCPLIEYPNDIFSSKNFFNNLKFINKNTLDILNILSLKFDIRICTIGTPNNISLKTKWISDKIPFIKQFYLLCNNFEDKKCIMDKSIIDMSGGIFIDDIFENLDSSNAEYKFIFGKEYPWSTTNKYGRLLNWESVYTVIEFLNIIIQKNILL